VFSKRAPYAIELVTECERMDVPTREALSRHFSVRYTDLGGPISDVIDDIEPAKEQAVLKILDDVRER
jgi:hypothetical protein